MNQAIVAEADVVIVGGGVAGLWLLNRLRQTGYSVLLLEADTLGGGQTTRSQGIIHGGMKYALQGVFTKDAQAMIDMPIRWKQCLEGKGDIDLTKVPVLSAQHYLWSPGKFVSKITGFLASTTLSSKVNALAKSDYPAVFKNPKFKGEVYALDELVIDVPVLVRELTQQHHDVMLKVDPLTEDDLLYDDDQQLDAIRITNSVVSADNITTEFALVKAKQFVFVAGEGNEILSNQFKKIDVGMQRRPLHMVMAKTTFDYPVYAHCLGLGNRPRMTITTHRMQDGSWVWYMGGSIAEEGVGKDTATQIKATKKELASLFPWLDFSDAEFASFMIDRAEPKQKTGFKPETSFSKSIQNVTVGWPTKLALAPKLADEIAQHLLTTGLTATHQADPSSATTSGNESANYVLAAWPRPTIANPVWEEMFCKKEN